MTSDVRLPETAHSEIPAEDLVRQHAALASELREAFESVLPVGRYTLGRQLREFEEEFARYVGTGHSIGVSSGTAALWLTLRALGIGPGDEVVTVPNTYVATAFAISYLGAVPVFVDVDPQTYNLDPAQLPAALSEKTKAVLPVHLYGQTVDIDALRAQAPGIPILEDAAHAHGATLAGRQAGSLGDAAAFSFYPSKVMGALGDGGVITLSNDDLAARIRQLRYMGQRGVKHDHQVLGYQERLDELQAAFLRVKLRHLEEQIEGRRRVAARYKRWLADTPVTLPVEVEGRRHVYYMYTLLAPRRDDLEAFLAERSIRTQRIYPRLVPDQGAYADLPWRAASNLEVARSLVPQLICLPMFAELEDGQIDRIGRAVREFYGLD